MPRITPQFTPEVIKGFVNGDDDSFAVVFAACQGKVYKVCYRFFGNQAIAEEITQEIFLRLWKARGSFREGAELTTWLTSISRNYCIDIYRGRRKERRVIAHEVRAEDHDRPSTDMDPHHLLDLDQQKQYLRSALGRIPRKHRTPMVLRELLELDYLEIADRLGIPVGTVKSRLNRGRTELAREMRKLTPGLFN
ncbi:MAG: RNA polymerase sigma factor [Candidatus Doudnabacteria bacterium]|nr:RNA polymerase sigma factor [Candidatus Doudnabacteria bacterium]